MSIHKNGGYRYASTQPIVVDPDRKSGRNKHVRKHWGIVDDKNVFHPNDAFVMLSPEERGILCFCFMNSSTLLSFGLR